MRISHVRLTTILLCLCLGVAVPGCSGNETSPPEAQQAGNTAPDSLFTRDREEPLRFLPETIALLGEKAPKQMTDPAEFAGNKQEFNRTAFNSPANLDDSEPAQSESDESAELAVDTAPEESGPTGQPEYSLAFIDGRVGNGKTSEERMWALLRQWKVVGYEAKDFERLVPTLHPNFNSELGEVNNVFARMAELGQLGFSFVYKDAKVSKSGDTAIVGPVLIADSALEFTLREVDSEWKLLTIFGIEGPGETPPDDVAEGAPRLRRATLPDVYNPDGAYEPIDEIQY